jgi:hypothetical protein
MRCVAFTLKGSRCLNKRRKCRSTCHVHKRYVLPVFDKDKMGRSVGNGFCGRAFLYGDQDMVVKLLPIKKKKEFENEVQVARRAGKFCVGPMVHLSHCDDKNCFIVMDRVMPVVLTQDDRDDVIRLFARAIKHKIVNVDGEFARTEDGCLVLYDYGVSSIVKSPAEAKKEYEEYLEQFSEMVGVDGVYHHFFKKSSSAEPAQKKESAKS